MQTRLSTVVPWRGSDCIGTPQQPFAVGYFRKIIVDGNEVVPLVSATEADLTGLVESDAVPSMDQATDDAVAIKPSTSAEAVNLKTPIAKVVTPALLAKVTSRVAASAAVSGTIAATAVIQQHSETIQQIAVPEVSRDAAPPVPNPRHGSGPIVLSGGQSVRLWFPFDLAFFDNYYDLVVSLYDGDPATLYSMKREKRPEGFFLTVTAIDHSGRNYGCRGIIEYIAIENVGPNLWILGGSGSHCPYHEAPPVEPDPVVEMAPQYSDAVLDAPVQPTPVDPPVIDETVTYIPNQTAVGQVGVSFQYSVYWQGAAPLPGTWEILAVSNEWGGSLSLSEGELTGIPTQDAVGVTTHIVVRCQNYYGYSDTALIAVTTTP